MKNLIIDLITKVNILLKKFPDKRQNELKYKLGELIYNFYLDNKKFIQDQTKDIDNAITSFYNQFELTPKKLDPERSKKISNWDKIKTAISEWLTKETNEDGFGLANLNYMVQFYRKYRNDLNNLEQAFRLNWSQNIELLKDRVTDDERKYYLKKAIHENLTVNELQEQIIEDSYGEFLKLLDNINYKFTIEGLKIKNFKSLVDISIESPSPFLVFAGANATGKTSIFEAIDLLIHSAMTKGEIAVNIFGGAEKIVNYSLQKEKRDFLTIDLKLSFEKEERKESINFGLRYDSKGNTLQKEFTGINSLDNRIINSFSRLFIDNIKRAQNKIQVYNKLWLDARNLNQILKEILLDKNKEDEINEWIQLLVPEVEKIKIDKDLTGREELFVYEKAYPDKPFTGELISEGTYNIIALLTILYQSDISQFICIEEPEIGLNPAILKELVPFFREIVSKYNHHIWITTHSTSLVSELFEEELIIVNKKNGKTFLHQVEEGDFEEMSPDDAWMSNLLKGGGLPW